MGPEGSLSVSAGVAGSSTVASGGTSGESILQLRHEGGVQVGIADLYMGPGTAGTQYSAVDAESRLRVDGIGPVRIGMAMHEARDVSGLRLVSNEGPYCGGLATDGPPAGLSYGSLNTGRVDFVTARSRESPPSRASGWAAPWPRCARRTATG